ncbi:MAG: ABC transporter permease [Bacteroidota bacterium]
MLRNYLTIALRFMLKQMGFTVINIFGLTVGITCSLLILLYVNDEVRYDRFHPGADRIYRLGFQGKVQGKKMISAVTGSPVAAGIQSAIPEVESTLRMATWATFPVRSHDNAFTEKYLLLADSNFFRFFNFELITGDPDNVLKGPGKIVISESAARRYFDYKGEGDLSPIGKKLMLAQGYEAEISGIAKDAPLNSHFHYSLILSLVSWDEIPTSGWINGKVITYFKLKPEASIKAVSPNIISFLNRKVSEELKEHKINIARFKDQGDDMEFFIQPMLDIHLKSHLSNEIEINGDIQYIYLFSSIAIFITLLACINFMNLSTARSVSRAKEVGVRKTVGAQYGTIIRQFLLESYLYIFIAVAIAFLLVLILMTPFNYFTEKQLSLRTFGHPVFFVAALLFTLVIGLLAGSYPAFYLTRYGPLEVLKGKLRSSKRSTAFATSW